MIEKVFSLQTLDDIVENTELQKFKSRPWNSRQ